MEEKILLHGYKKSEGVANIEVARDLASLGVPFVQSLTSATIENKGLVFERTIKIPAIYLEKVLDKIRDIQADNDLGKKEVSYCTATYAAGSKAAVKRLAHSKMLNKKGKSIDYIGWIKENRPREIYERTIIEPVAKIKKACAQYHGLRSENFRASALEELGFSLS